MALKTIGANLVLNGEKEYAAALKAIGAEQKELRSEMQLSAAQHSENANSLEALQEQYDILARQMDAQRDKVEVYETALEKAREKQDSAGEAVEKYSRQLEELNQGMQEMIDSGTATEEELAAQRQAIEDTERQLAKAQEAYLNAGKSVDNWQTGLNNANTQLIHMDEELQKTGKYLDEAKNSSDGFATSIDSFGKELDEAGDSAEQAGSRIKDGVASLLIAEGIQRLIDLAKDAGEALYGMATSAAFWADEVETLSVRTGVATDTIQALKYSEELLDVSLETVTQSMARNIRSMSSAQDGTAAYAEAYEKLGINVTDANGELRDGETVFWEVVDALGQMKNATEKDAIAMQLFGRSAQNLNTLIAAGSKGFKEMYAEADRVGYILETDTLDGLLKTSDAIERVSKTADAIKNQIGAEVAPVIEEAAVDIQRIMEENADDIAEVVADVIPALVDGLEFVVDHLDEILPVLEGVVTGFISFKAATKATELLNSAMTVLPGLLHGAAEGQTALNAAQAISPMGALAAAAGLLAVGLKNAMDAAGNYVPKVIELSEEHKKLIESASSVTTAVESSREAFRTNTETISGTRTQVTDLVTRLRELEPAAKNDKASMSEMEKVVDQLNTIMPDLGLSINSVTGELNMGVDAVENYTDALMRQIEQEAYSERLTEIIQEQIDLKNEMLQIEDEYNAAVEETNQAFYDKYAAVEAYNQALYDYENGISDLSQTELLRLKESAEAAEEYTVDTVQRNNDIRVTYNDLNNELSALDEEYETYKELLADTAPQEAAATANDTVAESFVSWRGYAVPATGDVTLALEELNKKYEEAKVSAEESLRSQMGLFEEFTVQSQSIDQMTSNMESQTTAMSQYGENLQKAMDLNIDPEIIADIEELGMSGAGYLQALVDAAEEGGASMEHFMEAWQENKKAYDELAEAMAEFEVGYSETMGLIVEDTTSAQEEITESQEEFSEGYVQSWSDMGTDTADAIAESQADVTVAVHNVATAALSTINEDFGIGEDGSSSKGRSAGESFGRSIADGIGSMENEIVNAVDRVGQAAQDRASEWARRIDEALGESV